MKIELTCNDETVMTTLKKLSELLGFTQYTHDMKDDVIRVDVTGTTVVKEEPKPTATADTLLGCHCEHKSATIKVKPPVESTASDVHVCKQCGKKFRTNRANQAYCSHRCKRKAAWKREAAAKAAEDDGHGGAQPKKVATPSTSPQSSFEKSLKVKKCEICGKEFKQKCPRQKYCSDDCKKKARLGLPCYTRQIEKAKEEKKVVPPTPVVKQSTPVAAPQPVKVENARPVFQFKCKLCDNAFQTTHKDQKYCNPCLDSFGEEQCDQLVFEEAQKQRAIAEAAKIRFKVCPKCGHTFEAKNPATEFFCPRCTQQALKTPMLKK